LNNITADDEMDKLVKHITMTNKDQANITALRLATLEAAGAVAATADPAVPPVPSPVVPVVHFPYKLIQNLKAMRFLYCQRLCTEQETNPTYFGEVRPHNKECKRPVALQAWMGLQQVAPVLGRVQDLVVLDPWCSPRFITKPPPRT
jgi:hypothetical protein